jgi:hypothetical protein
LLCRALQDKAYAAAPNLEMLLNTLRFAPAAQPIDEPTKPGQSRAGAPL